MAAGLTAGRDGAQHDTHEFPARLLLRFVLLVPLVTAAPGNACTLNTEHIPDKCRRYQAAFVFLADGLPPPG
jgi:hypothetical protein